MKKILCSGLILIAIIGISSCDYDDSNDLDILNPNDSTQSIVKESQL